MRCRHCKAQVAEDATSYHLEHCAGWLAEWSEAQAKWKALPLAEREPIAFATCGCETAWPSWWMRPDGTIRRVDCYHIDCQIKRGEKLPIDRTKGILAYERSSGWLRFMDEVAYQKLRDAVLAAAEKTGIYSPWEMPGGWQAMVFSGIGA